MLIKSTDRFDYAVYGVLQQRNTLQNQESMNEELMLGNKIIEWKE